MNGRIFIVEDEHLIADVLEDCVSQAGYQTAHAANVDEAIRTHERFRPDLMLLDIGLPGGDGLSVLATIRRRFDTPVIIITGLDDEVTKLAALRVGADDYIVKPFSPSEVVERVRTVLRRAKSHGARRVIHVGELIVDLEARTVSCRGADGHEDRRLSLTPTEFDLLAHMARQPKRAFSRNELLAAIARDSEAYDRVIDSHLSKLRQKLSAAGCNGVIEAVRGLGYRLWAEA